MHFRHFLWLFWNFLIFFLNSHMPHVTSHMSHVTYYMSHITCHLPPAKSRRTAPADSPIINSRLVSEPKTVINHAQKNVVPFEPIMKFWWLSRFRILRSLSLYSIKQKIKTWYFGCYQPLQLLWKTNTQTNKRIWQHFPSTSNLTSLTKTCISRFNILHFAFCIFIYIYFFLQLVNSNGHWPR